MAHKSVRREITTTPYFDDKVTEVMRRLGINRSEAYRHLQVQAEFRASNRQQLAHLVTGIKNEALSISREVSPRCTPQVNSIIRATTELLALL